MGGWEPINSAWEGPALFCLSSVGCSTVLRLRPRSPFCHTLLACRVVADVLTGVLQDFRPTLVLYDAGVDPHVDDALGRLALSDDGLRRRELLVGHCWGRLAEWAGSCAMPTFGRLHMGVRCWPMSKCMLSNQPATLAVYLRRCWTAAWAWVCQRQGTWAAATPPTWLCLLSGTAGCTGQLHSSGTTTAFRTGERELAILQALSVGWQGTSARFTRVVATRTEERGQSKERCAQRALERETKRRQFLCSMNQMGVCDQA